MALPLSIEDLLALFLRSEDEQANHQVEGVGELALGIDSLPPLPSTSGLSLPDVPSSPWRSSLLPEPGSLPSPPSPLSSTPAPGHVDSELPSSSFPTFEDEQPVAGSSSSAQQAPELDMLMAKLVSVEPSLPLPHILSLLAGSLGPDDVASGLLDTIGFDDGGWDLVQEILAAERPAIIRNLEEVIHPNASRAPSAPPAQTNGNAHLYIPPTDYVPLKQQLQQENAASAAAAAAAATAARSYRPGAQMLIKEKKVKRAGHDLFNTNFEGPSQPLRVPRNQQEADEMMAATLRNAANRPLNLLEAAAPEIQYPHVYQAAKSTLAGLSYGNRFALPMGTTREEYPLHEEVVIPPSNPIPVKTSERLIPITELDPLCAGSFPGYSSLNRIQSIVFPTAYGTNENLLICAPTGAGKTDVAMMSILRVLSQNLLPAAGKMPVIARNDFKIIYVAPMKALAAEITRKVGKRLAWVGIKVRELTGDMQLTRQEIADTQIIVTTPEKWDVVTRKPTGEGELASKVKLLIIDEVHLLNEERGAVIETIVARTLRQVESSQSLIRIVGLSATLPNYVDVSDFLRVSRYHGLFFFDASFRPVPLEQHFLGVKGKPQSAIAKKNMDEVVFEKVSELVRDGHQVMVFVHARKETVKTGMTLHEMAMKEGIAEEFDCSGNPRWETFKKDIGMSKNKEMKELFGHGIGIHHAGMLRSDRNLTERMFESGSLKVLCCTATLAWGVNLPAHAVIIKGTQVYDSSVGKFQDLSILDVLQIFGRAGRPGYETSGVGYICTTSDKLDHYLDAILSQHPIESKFVAGMIDSMNAEIALGTITNVNEAVQWMGYTYLFVRMKKNPFNYGMPHDVTFDDPQLGNKRNQLVTLAAKKLVDAKMIEFDAVSGKMLVTDLGRIAAKYYIRVESIEVFNTEFKPRMTEADVLAMLAMSTEFDQIQVRETELPELKHLMDEVIPCQVKGGTDTSQGKVNILLQGYISKAYIEDFALVSDTGFVQQNAGRIIRALLEIAISRRWAGCSTTLMSLSKAIEKKMWPFEHPMAQFSLSRDVLYNLQRFADELPVADLAASNADDLGVLIHLNKHHGAALLAAAKQFPTIGIRYVLHPLGHDLLEIGIDLDREFDWNEKAHGTVEPFYVWVEDHEGVNILQWANVLFRPSTSSIHLDFIIPIRSERPPSVTIRVTSDRWMDAGDSAYVSFENLVMPYPSSAHTPLLDLPYLPISTLKNAPLQAVYSQEFGALNAIQTQAFWSVYQSQANVLVCAPGASGKSMLGELAIWNTFRHSPQARVLLITPHRHSARELSSRLQATFSAQTGVSFPLLLRPADFEAQSHSQGSVSLTHPQALLTRLSSATPIDSWARGLSLIVLDDLHLLDAEYELAVSRLLAASKVADVRVVGLASSLNDPVDLGAWLGVDVMSILSFRPKDRGSALGTTVQTFNLPHSATLFKAMGKPTFDAINGTGASSTTGGSGGGRAPAIVFVPSRAQTISVANDLITQSGTSMSINGFLSTSPDQLEPYLGRLRDRTLVDPLLSGIGIYHDALSPTDIALVLELFASGIIGVLVVPREACWTLPVRAGTVVVMSTQYMSLKPGESFKSGGDRQIKNYSMQELFRMQSFAVQPIPSPNNPVASEVTGRFVLLCQAEHRDSFVRFLADGLPLESTLHTTPGLRNAIQAEMRRGNILTRQDGVDFLSHTFLARRVRSNPTYYEVEVGAEEADAEEGVRDRLSRVVDECMMGEKEREEMWRAQGKGKEEEGSRVLEVVEEKKVRYVPGSGAARPE